MNEEELIQAMKPASKSPLTERDLDRLGIKALEKNFDVQIFV